MITKQIPDGQRVFVTSDTHYGHRNIIKYCKRPHMTPEELRIQETRGDVFISNETLKRHDDDIIAKTNALVGPDDILIHCGDIAWKYDKLCEYRDRLNIKAKNVYVVFGNHDKDKDVQKLFPNAFERIVIEHAGDTAVIDHYPGDSWWRSHHGVWLLFGHIHGVGHDRRLQNPSYQLSQDCGVDLHDHRPWSWEIELKPLFESRKAKWLDWRQSLRDKNRGGMALS